MADEKRRMSLYTDLTTSHNHRRVRCIIVTVALKRDEYAFRHSQITTIGNKGQNKHQKRHETRHQYKSMMKNPNKQREQQYNNQKGNEHVVF